MRFLIAAPLLCAPSVTIAQPTAIPAVPDYSNSQIVEGHWTQAAITGGIEATFRNSSGQPQLFLTCLRPTRQVVIARPASVAAPMLQVWTNSASRNLPAAFNPATGRLSVTLTAMDPLLDAMALSRGRIAVGIAGQAAIVAPAWAEITRVVEECRL